MEKIIRTIPDQLMKDVPALVGLIGKVNTVVFEGRLPESLVVTSIDPANRRIDLAVSPGPSWNVCQHYQSGTWWRVADKNGNPIYQLVDLSAFEEADTPVVV